MSNKKHTEKIVRTAQLCRVLSTKDGMYGFAELVGVDADWLDRDVFVHTSERQQAGLSPAVVAGQEFLADIAETPKGLRAVNLSTSPTS